MQSMDEGTFLDDVLLFHLFFLEHTHYVIIQKRIYPNICIVIKILFQRTTLLGGRKRMIMKSGKQQTKGLP
jgi:hypothetical protein